MKHITHGDASLGLTLPTFTTKFNQGPYSGTANIACPVINWEHTSIPVSNGAYPVVGLNQINILLPSKIV